jgi:CheY-like chemotaxis protein
MRVLLVEDEADVRGFFVRALAHIGPYIEVLQATDGREALDLLLHNRVDLVLSDQRMPRMTGIELLIAVRSHSQVPFLLISADCAIERTAYSAGANEFLSKPISLDALRNAVARHLPPLDREYTG